MQKKNWKFKRFVNITFSRLKRWPKTLWMTTVIVSNFRVIMRKMKHPSPDLVGGVMVNQTYKLLCVGNPKVGSSSLKLFFQNELPDSSFYLNTSFSSFLVNNPDMQEYFKVAFVRNSWERIYSCWQDKISNNKRAADMFIITRFKGLYPDMPFGEFVDWLCSDSGSDLYADRHWMSQHKLLCIEKDKKNLDLIDDISNMNHQMSKITKSMQIPNAKFSSANSLGKAKNVDIFTPAIIQKIAKRYAEEINTFGFKPPYVS